MEQKQLLVDDSNEIKEFFDKNILNNDISVIKEIVNLNKNTLLKCDNVNKVKNVCEQIIKNIDLHLEEANTTEFAFNIDKLKIIFIKFNIKKKFPNFKLKRYFELLVNPFLQVKNFNGDTIKFDSFWVKKVLIAINQMILNEMDLYILNIGKEGSGKSCWSSQQILYIYTFLLEVGLIDYSYDIKKMYFADILSFLNEHETQTNKDYFKIEVLDEGNELSRGNYHDSTNKQFKYEMRTERKMLRIIMINMQQIGELDTSVSLSRVNFIYDCRMSNNLETGTLNKGFIDMYVIPRSDKIYSKKNKRNITRIEILNTIAKKLDNKKDYYMDLPKELIIHNFRFENFWGFDKDKYDDYVKDQMRQRKFLNKDFKVTLPQAYTLVKKISDFKMLGTFDYKHPGENKMYKLISKFFKKLETYFALNPDKYDSMEKYYNK